MDDERLHGFQTAATDRYGMLKDYAASLKRHETYAEGLLWEKLGQNRYDFKFRRQHIIGDYIADFVCLSCKLIVEIDGDYHAMTVQQTKDNLRTDILNDLGFTVMRFTNNQVESSPSSVAEQIFDKVFELLDEKDDE